MDIVMAIMSLLTSLIVAAADEYTRMGMEERRRNGCMDLYIRQKVGGNSFESESPKWDSELTGWASVGISAEEVLSLGFNCI